MFFWSACNGVEFGGKAVAFVIEFCIGRAIIINQKRMME